MGLFELHVDRIDVTAVPKFVLFGTDERDEKAGDTVSVEAESDHKLPLPVSVGTVLAVSIGATVLAVAVLRLKELFDRKLDAHC